MALQISPFGVAIALVLYALAFFLLRPLFRVMGSQPALRYMRWVLVLMLLVLPWADEIWIASRFAELCKNAGVHIYKKVEADGFYDQTSRSGYEYLTRLGFRFMEQPPIDVGARKRGIVEHIEKVGTDRSLTNIERPTARYHFKISSDNERLGYQLAKLEYVVMDSTTSEVIARQTFYKRYSGWIEGLWLRYFGSGMTMCPDPVREPSNVRYPESVFDLPRKSGS